MSKQPLVSIVSITYNQEKYIREALDSFLMQKTNFPVEIIVSDDCSTDKTPDIIKEYADKHPDVIRPIYRKKNIGAIANSIATLRAAKGKYIALCEGDDFWTDPLKLQKQADFMEGHKNYALCFHTVRVFFENNEQKESTWPNIQDSSKVTINELLHENFIPLNSVMYRRQNYDSLPDNVMPLDWYLHCYHAKFGKIGFMNKTMSSYRRHSEGIWWESHNEDQAKLWQQHGLQYANRYVELLKIYDDKLQREIIYAGLSDALSNLVDVDKKFGDRLLKTALATFPDAIEPFIIKQYEMSNNQKEVIEQNNQEIERLNQAVVDLRGQVFKLRDELHAIHGSRVVGRIIRFRKYLGVWIPRIRSLPRTLPRRVKLLVVSVLSESQKKQAVKGKRRLRSAKNRLFSGIESRKIQHITVANHAIQPGSPLVSVVIPYYNLADTIDDTLDSLDLQTFRNFETIIVNDGSSEPDSIDKLERIKRDRPDIKVIDQKNQGVAAARNTGMKLARGRYVICLDADDMLDKTYIEKCSLILETSPDVSLVTTQMEVFGVVNEQFEHVPYDPKELYSNNMVITAAEFRRNALEVAGGYKSNIGYEDWEHWMNLAEHGFWGKSLLEPLFKYRTSLSSRYVEDKDIHWKNIKAIRSLHPNYRKNIKQLHAQRKNIKHLVDPKDAFVNMDQSDQFIQADAVKKNILITVPWMTFGGAETLIYNYCREVKDKFNLSFVTGLKSDNEWEYKFREITPSIYHLANLFEDERLYLEFVSSYIKTRNIDTLHIIHNGFTFDMLPELRKQHPKLTVVLTLFNDRVEYFDQSIEFSQFIDVFTSDNQKVTNHFLGETSSDNKTNVIPNGINCYDEFNPQLYDRPAQRESLGLADNELAVFFVGRLSVEKNPDVFLETAKKILKEKKQKQIKFFVIGDGPMRSVVEKRIKEIGSKNVTYLGYRAEVAQYFSAADIFVLPSAIEGFPLSILEAMAMKVAVIASDVGAVSEVINDGVDGFVIPPASVSHITETIKMLNNDPKRLQLIKKASRQKVEKKYSNRLLGANYQKLYNEASK